MCIEIWLTRFLEKSTQSNTTYRCRFYENAQINVSDSVSDKIYEALDFFLIKQFNLRCWRMSENEILQCCVSTRRSERWITSEIRKIERKHKTWKMNLLYENSLIIVKELTMSKITLEKLMICWNDDVNEKRDERRIVDCNIDLVRAITSLVWYISSDHSSEQWQHVHSSAAMSLMLVWLEKRSDCNRATSLLRGFNSSLKKKVNTVESNRAFSTVLN